MDRKHLTNLLLTAGLVLVFGWFGIDKFNNGFLWVGFLPGWMDGFAGLSKNLWIQIVGAVEILLALLLLIPVRRVRQAGALLIALHLVAILWQVGWNDVGVRDIGLLFMSVALLTAL